MNEANYRNALKPGYELHWYRIERVLGQGGFGITYLARDLNLDIEVAIKEYLPTEFAVREPDLSVQPDADMHAEQFDWGLDRFIKEARILNRFRHPNIVRVLAVFEANKTGYMVMEYEHGENLKELLKRRKTLTEDEILNILWPILDGLETVHEHGFIHRDIKPANIMIRADGSPVLIDFGSARQALGVQTKTLTSLISHGYTPFEQYFSKGQEQGPWTDIYSLGATIYRAVVGKVPLDAMARSRAILESEPDPYQEIATIWKSGYSAHFLNAIDHALRFRQKERPQSVVEWRDEFQAEEEEVLQESNAEPDEDIPQESNAESNAEIPTKTVVEKSSVEPSPDASYSVEKEVAENDRSHTESEKVSISLSSFKRGVFPSLVIVLPIVGIVVWKVFFSVSPEEATKIAGEFVRIKPGCFEMGSPESEEYRYDNERLHRVCISKVFELGKYEVTQRQWERVMGENPSNNSNCGPDCPVENVSWEDVQDFIDRLNNWSGPHYRLPTEAEWEYACRSGGKDEKYCGGNDPDKLAWYADNSGVETHPVGRKDPNGLGLHDMSGNVWEWVHDWYGGGYYEQSPVDDPEGPLGGSRRVFRGGGWYNRAGGLRSALRYVNGPGLRSSSLGFRLARTP